MARISQSLLSLRLFGDDLIPEEISAALGTEPTESYRKGEKRVSRGNEYVRKHGMWLLKAKARQPEDLEGQISELLSKLTQDLATWRSLSNKFEVDLFCGLFMSESNEGFSLPAEVLVKLGERGINIGFDVYDPTKEEESAS